MTALASAAGVVYMQAMPRLREVSRDEANPCVRQIYQMHFGERDPVREPGTDTGSPGNWWTVFALVTMADAFHQLAAALES